MDHARLFGFESELESNLTYIPLAVRFKLDQCGIKLSLAAWQLLSNEKRRELLLARCDTAENVANYRKLLCSFVRECMGDEPAFIVTDEDPLWAADNVPEQIVRAIEAMGAQPLSRVQWGKLTPLERFALIKLSREGREHRKLAVALCEFGVN